MSLSTSLDRDGGAHLSQLLTEDEARRLRDLYGAADVPRCRPAEADRAPAEVPGRRNALHRDLYGDLVFPLQVVVNLSAPGIDYTGGEFLLVEQRPRAQSRGTAVQIPFCHGYVFTTRDRPVASKRGWSAAPVRHGVSEVRRGTRYTLGLVFHDAA